MLQHPGYWKLWLILGFVIVIAFTWFNEILDLPHIIFGAPATPVNWLESLMESVFLSIMTVLCWVLIRTYESRWRETAETLQSLATRDELSGLLNRREFLARAETEFERARRFGHSLSIALLDLDHFKKVNDTHGHITGDGVIRELAAELNLHVRQQDLVGRIGGDEFMVAFIETSRSEAWEICNRIQQAWRTAETVNGKGGRIHTTFSMGLTSAVKKDQSLLDCIERADKALYTAKQKGRDKIVQA